MGHHQNKNQNHITERAPKNPHIVIIKFLPSQQISQHYENKVSSILTAMTAAVPESGQLLFEDMLWAMYSEALLASQHPLVPAVHHRRANQKAH
jgi:hypothetical protein